MLNQKRIRKTDGSVILMCCVTFAVVSAVLLIAYSFCGLYLVHNRLQCTANEIALVGAKKLNDKDRIGQMNNMIARCRQLVYTSREELEDTKKEMPNLEFFAEPLLKESRESAANLESERQQLTAIAKREAVTAMEDQFNAQKASYMVTLPWMKISAPQMKPPTFGKVDGLESNVEELTEVDELAKEDRGQNLVDVSSTGKPDKGLDLYKADTDHKLKGSDSDLNFKLSSLPPPVRGVISPARVLLPRSFKESGSNDYAPCADQVELKIKVQTGLGPSASSLMESLGTSITTGASAQL